MTHHRDPNRSPRILGLPLGIRRDNPRRDDVNLITSRVALEPELAKAFASGVRGRLSHRYWRSQAIQFVAFAAYYWVLLAAPRIPGGLTTLINDAIRASIPGTAGGLLAGAVMIALLFVIPILGLVWIDQSVWRRRVRRELLRCLHQPACFFCGYDHSAIEIDDPAEHRCPECGAEHPIAVPTITEDPTTQGAAK